MSDIAPEIPEVEVHPSEQGPFTPGKQVELGGQPVDVERPVTGMAATDKDAALVGAVDALTEAKSQLQIAIDKLSTNPAIVTATTRSFLNFLLNQTAQEITRIQK